MSASLSAAHPAPGPLSPQQSSELERLVAGLDAAGLWWVAGYSAGLARASGPTRAAGAPAQEWSAAPAVTIVYGSQTGNARRVAETLARQCEGAQLATRLVRADTYSLRELKHERLLYVVISTQGDGDPPDDARDLVESLTGKRAPALPDLEYAVLGLGDSSYPRFCAIARVIDERLAELGATRVQPRGEADLDIDVVAEPWLAQALATANSRQERSTPIATVTPLFRATRPPQAQFTRERPFLAEVRVNQRITGRGSVCDVRHLELSLEGSHLSWEPGDSLGVWPRNAPALVDAVLTEVRRGGDEPVTVGDETLPLHEWLVTRRELTRLARPFVARHAARARSAELDRLLAPENAELFTQWASRHQVIDVLRKFPADWAASDLVAALRPLTPRLYSIASSAREVGDEAHLTVARVAYGAGGEKRFGVASDFLARAEDGDAVPVFIEANDRFRLPRDTARDAIMIGPGTGVAPFRGFVQERVATGAQGRNWLFFGNPHQRSDFLYQLEWQRALKSGALHRLDLAFSRDQLHKVYVQDRLRERGAAVFAWLEGGAHLYVCGDATRMARDVHAVLLEIVARHGGKTDESAREYLGELAAQGRYARDVY